MIACVVIPFFAAAAQRLLEPMLAAVPLVIGEPAQAPQRVYAVSGEAAAKGVQPGMPLRQAQLRCPQARLIPAQPDEDQRLFDDLLAVLAHFSQRIEPAGSHPAAISYLDLGQLAKTEPAALAQQIGRSIREQVRLTPAVGLATGKFPAYVAALSTTPGKARLAPPGREAAFLAQRPLDLLPLDGETSRRCRLLGLRTLGQFAALPAGAVLNQFGSPGRWLHQLARGEDRRPVTPPQLHPSEQVTRAFDGPVTGRETLDTCLQLLAGELAGRLHAGGRAARQLALTLQLEDGRAREEQRRLGQPASRPERLLQNFKVLLNRVPLTCGIIALTAGAGDLAPVRAEQLELFPLQTAQEQQLGQVLPDLLARYGPGCFYQLSLIDQTATLPERRFRLQPMAQQ